MNYYDKTLKEISSIISSDPYSAMKMIEDELNAPYLPRDFLAKLNDLKSKINIEKDGFKLDLNAIKEYLSSSEDKQCIAVEELSKLNLREYEDIVSDYLLSKGSLRAKIMLVISLFKQESNHTYSILKGNKIYQFIPNNLIMPESSEYFLEVSNMLADYYLKNPDMLHLAKELLYDDYIMNLPEHRDLKDTKYMFNKITKYIDDSFSK